MKRWKQALGDIRLLGPDEEHFRNDVEDVWIYIETLEAALREIAKSRTFPIRSEDIARDVLRQK